MWVRLTTVTGAPDDVARALRFVERQALPALRDTEGWRGAVGLVSKDRRKGLTLTFWENEDHLAASAASSSEFRRRAAAAGADLIPNVEPLEVVFTTDADELLAGRPERPTTELDDI